MYCVSEFLLSCQLFRSKFCGIWLFEVKLSSVILIIIVAYVRFQVWAFVTSVFISWREQTIVFMCQIQPSSHAFCVACCLLLTPSLAMAEET